MSIGLAELAIVVLILVIMAGGAAVIVLGTTAASKDPRSPRRPGRAS